MIWFNSINLIIINSFLSEIYVYITVFSVQWHVEEKGAPGRVLATEGLVLHEADHFERLRHGRHDARHRQQQREVRSTGVKYVILLHLRQRHYGFEPPQVCNFDLYPSHTTYSVSGWNWTPPQSLANSSRRPKMTRPMSGPRSWRRTRPSPRCTTRSPRRDKRVWVLLPLMSWRQDCGTFPFLRASKQGTRPLLKGNFEGGKFQGSSSFLTLGYFSHEIS